MSNRRTANLHINTPSENKNGDNNNPAEKKTESLQDETSVEPTTNPTDNEQEKPLQTTQSSYSEKFTGQRPNTSVEMQKQFSEISSSEQTQTENKCSRLQQEPRIEPANQIIRKQELERNQLIQKLSQLDAEIQQDKILS